MSGSRRVTGYIYSLVLFATLLIVWVQRQAVYDWLRLRGYVPPAAIVQLADATTMTGYTRHLFYVNRPAILNREDFNQSCPANGGEQTIILGCYHGHESGIYLYSVTDPKLSGVEQVTAAHEALHAIYDRLSTKDKNYVNGLLENYYKHDLQDKRLLDTIAAYKKSEPGEVVNEMHSVFGTEVLSLPPKLEAYYKQYFTNRAKIVAFSQKYQSTFTSRQVRADALLAKIKSLEQKLGHMKAQIDSSESQLKSEYQAIQSSRSTTTDKQAFNTQVDAYSAQVAQYQALISSYNSLIAQHNDLVAQYQSISVETNQLIQELNSRSATVTAQ